MNHPTSYLDSDPRLIYLADPRELNRLQPALSSREVESLSDDSYHQLESALDRLSSTEQDAVHLLYRVGLPQASIAELLKVSQQAISAACRSAYRRLSQALLYPHPTEREVRALLRKLLPTTSLSRRRALEELLIDPDKRARGRTPVRLLARRAEMGELSLDLLWFRALAECRQAAAKSRN